jgi:hypothetical protein
VGAVTNCRSRWFGITIVAYRTAKAATRDFWHRFRPANKNVSGNKPPLSDGISPTSNNFACEGSADLAQTFGNVRYWHFANVKRGTPMSAFDPKRTRWPIDTAYPRS